MRDLSTKSFGSFEIKDEERGEVVAIVATLEVVDRDGDVILPGAFPMGGAKVKLSGYGHDVVLQDAPPVGIGTISEEGGKAVFEGRFFMSTERGREAFATVKELGTDGEWSFGFPNATVKTAKMTEAWRERGAKRLLAGLEPVEASPVFRGAGLGTMTMHVKGMKAEDDSLTDRISAVNDALHARNEAQPEAERDRYWWGREVFDDHVIVEAGARLLRIEYTVDDEGRVTLGEATEVEIVYQVVAEKSAEGGQEMKAEEVAEGEDVPPAVGAPTPEEAGADSEEREATDLAPDEEVERAAAEEKAAQEAEQKAAAEDAARRARAAEAVEEYERVRRTLKRMGVA